MHTMKFTEQELSDAWDKIIATRQAAENAATEGLILKFLDLVEKDGDLHVAGVKLLDRIVQEFADLAMARGAPANLVNMNRERSNLWASFLVTMEATGLDLELSGQIVRSTMEFNLPYVPGADGLDAIERQSIAFALIGLLRKKTDSAAEMEIRASEDPGGYLKALIAATAEDMAQSSDGLKDVARRRLEAGILDAPASDRQDLQPDGTPVP